MPDCGRVEGLCCLTQCTPEVTSCQQPAWAGWRRCSSRRTVLWHTGSGPGSGPEPGLPLKCARRGVGRLRARSVSPLSGVLLLTSWSLYDIAKAMAGFHNPGLLAGGHLAL